MAFTVETKARIAMAGTTNKTTISIIFPLIPAWIAEQQQCVPNFPCHHSNSRR